MRSNETYLELSDQELLLKIQENSDYLGVVYKRCKTNSLGFMRKITFGKISNYELEDVFQDATIILYEKIVKGNFVLTASFQVYLNSVCRFQLLNTIEKSKLTTDYQDNSDEDDDENPNGYYSSITDSLDEIGDPKEEKFLAIERALDIMKNSGGKCYELISQFWYYKKSMKALAEIFDYSNDKTAKKQKSNCQEKLRKLTFNEMNKIS